MGIDKLNTKKGRATPHGPVYPCQFPPLGKLQQTVFLPFSYNALSVQTKEFLWTNNYNIHDVCSWMLL